MTQYLKLAIVKHFKVLVNELQQKLQRILHGLDFLHDHLNHFERICLLVELFNNQRLFNQDGVHEFNDLLLELKLLLSQPLASKHPSVIHI